MKNQQERLLKYRFLDLSRDPGNLRWGPGTCILIRALGGPDSCPLPKGTISMMLQPKRQLHQRFPSGGPGQALFQEMQAGEIQ